MDSKTKGQMPSCAVQNQSKDVNLQENVRKSKFTIPRVIDLSQTHASGIHFNNDRRYYTPSFLHESNDNFYQHNDSALKIKFQQKMDDARNKKKQNTIYQPIVQSEFCYVCKEIFSDYMNHINHPYHIRRIQTSQYRYQINDLCQIINNPKRLRSFQNIGNVIQQRSPRKRFKKQESEDEQTQMSTYSILDSFWS